MTNWRATIIIIIVITISAPRPAFVIIRLLPPPTRGARSHPSITKHNFTEENNGLWLDREVAGQLDGKHNKHSLSTAFPSMPVSYNSYGTHQHKMLGKTAGFRSACFSLQTDNCLTLGTTGWLCSWPLTIYLTNTPPLSFQNEVIVAEISHRAANCSNGWQMTASVHWTAWVWAWSGHWKQIYQAQNYTGQATGRITSVLQT